MAINEEPKGSVEAQPPSDLAVNGVKAAAEVNGDHGKAAPPAYQSHPLGPLTGKEISQASSLIKASWPAGTDCHFKVVTLLEPAKAQLVPYLAAERSSQSPTDIDRRAFVVYYFRGTVSQIRGLAQPKLFVSLNAE